MKKYSILVCLSIAIFSTGCKKEIQQPLEVKPQLALIKQTMNGSTPYNLIEEFVYNENKQIKEIRQYGTNSSLINKRYTYMGNQLQFRYYISGTEQTDLTLFYIFNSSGLIAEVSSSYYKFKLVYEYNEKMFVKKLNHFNGGAPAGYAVYNYSSSDRLDSLSFYSADNSLAYVSVFAYSAGNKNTIGNENKGQQMFGKDQQLPLIKETRFVYNSPFAMGIRSRFFELEYDYTYDEKGRIKTSSISRTDYAIPGGGSSYYPVATYEYTYR